MIDGAAKAENAGNLIKSVWYNAIFEERNSETDKYTVKNGKFVDDLMMHFLSYLQMKISATVFLK